MAMKRILVTGGAGYIGSHTCKALALSGYEPVTLDNLVAGHRWAVNWGPLVQLDMTDAGALADVLRRERIDAVMHFAGYLLVGESMQNPGKYYANNVTNTVNLLDAMAATGVGTIVFSSTAAVYGNPERSPIPEDHPHRPINPYGESKLAIERALHWYGIAHGLKWTALRYFNACGADPDGQIGESHDPETHLIPLVVDAALGKRPPISVFGTDYPTPDGTAVRDFIHVTDLADAHVRALRRLDNGGASLALNLGTGEGYSVRQILETARAVIGSPIPQTDGPRRPGDPPVLVADARSARRELEWTPTMSDLETILQTALAWHRKGT